MTPKTVARLAKIDTVAAIKEASGSLDQVDQIRQLTDLPILSGDDSLTFPMMALGAKGVISVMANVVPDRMRDMVHAALRSDFDEAREIHGSLYPLSKTLFIETNPVPVKAALAMMRKISAEVRLPLTEMSRDNKQELREALRKLGVVR